ncbi:MAG TPA: hypothetical protein PK299_02035 [Anaerolineales bacterium]|nr:hypothetical protein [Anaerolineales bacterium]
MTRKILTSLLGLVAIFGLWSVTACTVNPFQPSENIVATIVSATQTATANQTNSVTPQKPSRILPAPLYLLSANDGKIWRIETDAVSTTQVSQHTAPISEFDVSPVDDSLLFVSNNELRRSQPQSAESVLLASTQPVSFESAVYISNVPINQFFAPLWNPNGIQIAFGFNGIKLMNAQTGTYADWLNNTAEQVYRPLAWSVDGKQLAVIAYPVNAGNLQPQVQVINVKDQPAKPVVLPTNSEQLVWFGNQFVVALRQKGGALAELWISKAAEGGGYVLLESNSTPYHLLRPLVLQNGTLNYFMADELDAQNRALYQMMTINLLNPQQNAVLRAERLPLMDALWARDGSGAVVSLYSPITGVTSAAEHHWLSVDNAPAVILPMVGSALRWGKGN